ncbi:alpha/beta fold hydrolase [uncultured Kordia sp.]|uniref:alpha/beta fold hydrolase n=1 Tax=uncultured Kordia sp. TaxID=507699 RepID=UPI002617F51F|nr:alpha/beta fold hydrolase [uncultured Kordia sp.]
MNTYMKNIFNALLLLITCTALHGQEGTFKKVDSSYHRYADYIEDDAITWGYLSVPEDWNQPMSDSIKIAVSVLKNTSGKANAEALVFIQGGPGQGSVDDVWSWLNHSLRKNHDIVLFDTRGTGYSQPRLCPDLGKEFLAILAKNQSPSKDEEQKANAALACKSDLIKKGINVEAYQSTSVAKDLHALKNSLGYKQWNIYGVSYGTYMAQVYANMFPNDISKLILDSSISNITEYYTANTTNYMTSLQKVFKACEADENCNKNYPNIENIYYEVIADLEKNPITVDVDKFLIESESFTFNAEDFKVALQQALYNKQLVAVIPLLIYEFKARNKIALGNLVPAFSALLNMDYGVYYCVSCNETLPVNDIETLEQKSNSYKGLKGPISFYKSDFVVCDQWNIQKDSIIYQNLDKLKESNMPVLVFGGEFDPITPEGNAEKTANLFNNGTAVTAYTYGHVPSFTRIGTEVVTAFIDKNEVPEKEVFKKAPALQIVNSITVNGGVSSMGNSLDEQDPLFLTPLLIALGVALAFIIAHGIKLIRRKYKKLSDKIVRILCLLTSVFGIISLIGFVNALLTTVDQNFYILAFGLPSSYDYLYIFMWIFLGLLSLTLLFYVIKIKQLNERSILFSIVFSNILIAVYFLYWGII